MSLIIFGLFPDAFRISYELQPPQPRLESAFEGAYPPQAVLDEAPDSLRGRQPHAAPWDCASWSPTRSTPRCFRAGYRSAWAWGCRQQSLKLNFRKRQLPPDVIRIVHCGTRRPRSDYWRLRAQPSPLAIDGQAESERSLGNDSRRGCDASGYHLSISEGAGSPSEISENLAVLPQEVAC